MSYPLKKLAEMFASREWTLAEINRAFRPGPVHIKEKQMSITEEKLAYAQRVLRGHVAFPTTKTSAGARLFSVLQEVANHLAVPEDVTPENIILDYPLYIHRDNARYKCPRGAEFFMDEHGIQWVKFIPSNGYGSGKEHIWRTENVTIIVDNISGIQSKLMDRAVAGADLREGRDAAIGAPPEDTDPLHHARRSAK